MSKTLLAFAACLALAPALARGESLASAAETFVEHSLSLPEGSVRAHSVDPKLSLGECETGWQWSFPYEARTTVQVICTASPTPSRRSVAVRYPTAEGGSDDRSSPAAHHRSFVVAARDLAIGAVLRADDLGVVPVAPKDRVFSSTLSDPDALVGLALTRPVRKGENLGRADVRSAQTVKRNSSVSAWSSFPGGRVVAKLTALQNGKTGDWIDVENPQSGRRLRGVVQADGTVMISGYSVGSGAQGLASRVD